MKLLSIACASFVALALTASGALAATFNGSKSNTYKIGLTAGTTEADCIKAHGVITTNPDGTKTCTVLMGSKVQHGMMGPGGMMVPGH